MSIFPNPARNLINISYTSSKIQSNASTMVYDLLGRLLTKKSVLVQAGPNQLTLSLDNMLDGIYLLVLETQNNPVNSRHFIIRH